ncbi:MAG TPA: rod-binding protein [Acidobacteriaceae bacterium]|nr:rod-binding protein [Acidobacteriaceae bacterium]
MGTNLIGPGGLSSQTSLQQVREQQLMQQVKSLQPNSDDARIDKSAKDFESMLLGTWLRQAEASFATVPGADSDDDDSGTKDQMMSLGVQSLAQSMVDAGGIGIAKMIETSLHRQAEKAAQPAQAAKEGSKRQEF